MITVRRFFVGFFGFLSQLLNHPSRVLWFCVFLIFVNLVADGSLFRLWSLYRDQVQLERDIVTLKSRSTDLRAKLQKAKDPSFLEKEARDRFDLVSAGNLVFVFSDEQDLDEK
jgi:cell division protein FtsB